MSTERLAEIQSVESTCQIPKCSLYTYHKRTDAGVDARDSGYIWQCKGLDSRWRSSPDSFSLFVRSVGCVHKVNRKYTILGDQTSPVRSRQAA